MIRIYQTQLVTVEGTGETLERSEIYCNSTDTKPTTGLVNGSTLTEVDTGKTYLFDESNSSWTEVSAGGGGGGGGVFVITPIYEEVQGEPTVSFDKTYQEIAAAVANNKTILIDDSDEEVTTTYLITEIEIQNGTITLKKPLICYKNAATTMAIVYTYYNVDEENNVEVVDTEYVVALNQ